MVCLCEPALIVFFVELHEHDTTDETISIIQWRRLRTAPKQ